MNLTHGNLFAGVPQKSPDEIFTELARGGSFRLVRIVSTAQVTPVNIWLDQPEQEWVVLLSGSATLHFANEPRPLNLATGDFVLIPAHCRHRVERTDSAQPTVWLALHFTSPDEISNV
jgi:cupin 2 domain-containing protein